RSRISDLDPAGGLESGVLSNRSCLVARRLPTFRSGAKALGAGKRRSRTLAPKAVPGDQSWLSPRHEISGWATRSFLTPQCLVSLCRRMDFARSRPDTGIGDRGSGTALLSVPAGTAARRDRHGNHSRLPAWHGNGGKGVCRGFQGAFLCGGGCGELLPVLPRLVLLLCAGETASGGAPPRHSEATLVATR